MNESSALYIGEVVHQRLRPKRHKLRYGVFALLVDLDALPVLDRRLKLLSVGRFNLFSIHARDFGPHDGSSIAGFIRRRARSAGLGAPVTRIRMLCYPRLLGYAFNPLTTYYLETGDGRTAMVVFEVHNTFGGHHFYDAILAAGDGGDGPEHRFSMPKSFYVSPFNTSAGSYRFAVRTPEEEVLTRIMLSDADGPILNAWFAGRRKPLSDGMLLRLAVHFPLMTLKVIAGIYWEALRLWVKGVPLTLAQRR